MSKAFPNMSGYSTREYSLDIECDAHLPHRPRLRIVLATMALIAAFIFWKSFN